MSPTLNTGDFRSALAKLLKAGPKRMDGGVELLMMEIAISRVVL